MSKFDSRESTLKSLGKNKKPDCINALTHEFNYAVDALGLSFHQASVYAEVTHYLKDHNGHNDLPELNIDATDEAVHESLQADIDEGPHKDQAEQVLRWYDLIRSWDVPVQLALSSAVSAASLEWEENNDLDEAEVISQINALPSERLKDNLLRKFYTLRNEGESVRASYRIARDRVKEELRTEAIFSALNSGRLNLGKADFLN